MTETLTQENLGAVVSTTPFITGTTNPKVPSEEAAALLGLKPIPTVWAWEDGKPVYDRLPAISQQYQLGYDKDQAYAYIEPQFGTMVGPGSLQPFRSATSQEILSVESGTITWKHGNVDVESLTLNINTLDNGRGLEDGIYQIGCTLTYGEDPLIGEQPGYEIGSATGSLLDTAAIKYIASSTPYGHLASYALNARSDQAWWPSDTANAGSYSEGGWFVIDFLTPVASYEFKLTGDPTKIATAPVALYYSDDGIIWYQNSQVDPVDNVWTLIPSNVVPAVKHRYWRFFFWDGSASISTIHYTGDAYWPDNRPNVDWARATYYVQSLYDTVEGDYYLVASFTVQDGVIRELTDQRRTIDRKYEPVAEWLTSYQDLRLRCLFEDIEHYSERFLAPPTADFGYYTSLDDSDCLGSGPIDIGTWTSTVSLLPEIVELGDNFTGAMSPFQVIEVGKVVVVSDLATKYETDTRLNDWIIDDGIY